MALHCCGRHPCVNGVEANCMLNDTAEVEQAEKLADTARSPPDKNFLMLEEERKIMTAYSEAAKGYMQLSLGAIVFSVAFFQKVLAYKTAIPIDNLLLLSWIFWLLAILFSMFYQSISVTRIEK